jgi:hypothetical protein
MPAEHARRTPWLRRELLEVASKLANRAWLRSSFDTAGRPNRELSAVLDFLDDSAVLDRTQDLFGTILWSGQEVASVSNLATRLDEALATSGDWDAWDRVGRAADGVLSVLSADQGDKS